VVIDRVSLVTRPYFTRIVFLIPERNHSGGSIPPNILEPGPPTDLLKFGNNAANDLYTERCKDAGQKIHPARFSAALPEFFIKLLTDEADIVLDPFAGSNTTGAVAEAAVDRGGEGGGVSQSQ
jgi:DNA modification methylase